MEHFVRFGHTYHDFRGSGWTNIKNADNRNYLKNVHRVLLTRARQGLVLLCLPVIQLIQLVQQISTIQLLTTSPHSAFPL